MKPIKILCLLFMAFAMNSYAQDYFIVNKKDTTFCKNFEYELTMQGYLKSISYTAESGEEISFKKRKNVPNITTFSFDGLIKDKVPQNFKKPNSYVRFTDRIVSGKVKLYLYYPYDGNIKRRVGVNPNIPAGDLKMSQTARGVYQFFLQLPDGAYIKINNKKKRTKIIIPFLNKCAKFKEKYDGNFRPAPQVFERAISLYNELCDS